MLVKSKSFVLVAFLMSSVVAFSQTRVEAEKRIRAAIDLCNSQKVRSELTIKLITSLANQKAEEGLTSFNPIVVSTNANVKGISFSILSNGFAIKVKDAVGIIDLDNDALHIGSKPEFNKKSKAWSYRCFVYYVATSPFIGPQTNYDGWITKIYDGN